mgnify:CR=1 FL=1
MGLSSGMGSHLEKDQARLCNLVHGGGEFARPLAQVLQLPLYRCKLL